MGRERKLDRDQPGSDVRGGILLYPYEEEPVTGKKKPAEKKKRPAKQPSVKIPASPLDVISEKVGQIIKRRGRARREKETKDRQKNTGHENVRKTAGKKT